MKLPEADRAELRKRGAKPLRTFPKAPIKKDYVVLPRAVRENTRSLRAWARKSVEYAVTLPAPKKRNPRPTRKAAPAPPRAS